MEQILQLLQYMLDTLSISPDKFQPATELLVKEASLLRGWRKADNKFLEKYRKEEK